MVSFVKQTYTNLELISKYSIFHSVEKKYKDNSSLLFHGLEIIKNCSVMDRAL